MKYNFVESCRSEDKLLKKNRETLIDSPAGRVPTESEMNASRGARSNANTFFQISGFSVIEINDETSGCVRASIWLNEIVLSRGTSAEYHPSILMKVRNFVGHLNIKRRCFF